MSSACCCSLPLLLYLFSYQRQQVVFHSSRHHLHSLYCRTQLFHPRHQHPIQGLGSSLMRHHPPL